MSDYHPIPTRTVNLCGGKVSLVGHTVAYNSLRHAVDEDGDLMYDEYDQPVYTLPDTLDHIMADAARVSYTTVTKRSTDAALIDRLVRDRHTSPLEQITFTFVFEDMSLFVIQQLLRHRTAKLNQESGRYSQLAVREEVADNYFSPDAWRAQSSNNKQGSFGLVEDQYLAERTYQDAIEAAHEAYEKLIAQGVTRELARIVLPAATKTRLTWSCDVHNLLHFLKLRLAPDAQQEIREFAQGMLELIEPLIPDTIASWRNHVLNAMTLSYDEQLALSDALVTLHELVDGDPDVLDLIIGKFQEATGSKTRSRELAAKVDRLLNMNRHVPA